MFVCRNLAHRDTHGKPLPMPPATVAEITLANEELARLLTIKEPKLSKRKQVEQADRAKVREQEEKRARLLAEEEQRPLGRGCPPHSGAATEPLGAL